MASDFWGFAEGGGALWGSGSASGVTWSERRLKV